MKYILTTENLTKTYGQKDAAKDINIHIREGSIYGLIGRNGAGKTTVMRMISGLSKPTSGTYQMYGEHKFGVGVLIESPEYIRTCRLRRTSGSNVSEWAATQRNMFSSFSKR